MEETENQIHTPSTCNAQLAAVGDALYVIGGKWKLRIILALSEGPRRFNDLQRTVAGISARVLSNELKDMELIGFVKRNVYVQTPVVIEYELMEYSKTVMPVVQALRDWGVQHRAYVQNQGRAKATAE